MSKIMILVSVTGAWVLVAGALGIFLARKGKPYNKAIAAIHAILSLFIIAGTISCISQLQLITDSKLFLSVSIYLLATGCSIKVISGISLVIIRNDNRKGLLFHKIATYLIIIALVAGLLFSALKI